MVARKPRQTEAQARSQSAARATGGEGSSSTERTELLISIGGVVGHLTLGAAPAPFLAQLRERYAPYTVPPAPWVECEMSLVVTFAPAAPIASRASRARDVAAHPLQVRETDTRIDIRRWDFEASLSPGPRAAKSLDGGHAIWEGEVTCQMNPFAFDSLLRVLWAVFLPRKGGALFHACALRLGEAGVIFPGPSGAGKSTLARKMPDPERILTDELVAVSRGELGRWRISGTPFWGEFKRGGGSIRSWPLRAVAFLEKGRELSVQPLSGPEAALRLLGCFLCFQDDPETAARNLAIAADLSTDVAALRLQSTAETAVSAIEGELAPHLPDRSRRDHPPTAREMISEFRWLLSQARQYAFRPKGTSMRPWLKPGDALFIEAAGEASLASGDILLYWTPGPRPEDDRLTCHRMVARVKAKRGTQPEHKFKYYMKGDARSGIERFENGRESEILGRVSAISRDGRTWPVSGRIGSLAKLVGSLVATPILRMTGR